MQFEHELSLASFVLESGREWAPTPGNGHVLEILQGSAYLFDQEAVKDLARGSVLVVPDHSKTVVRASRIEACHVRGFRARAASLTGVMSLAEAATFCRQDSLRRGSARVFAPDDAYSRFIHANFEESASLKGLRQRARLLDGVAEFLNIAGQKPGEAAPAAGLARFRQALLEMPESELETCMVDELAKRCGCSTRHLNRLFRQQFGVSLKAKQVELRLERASRLLRTSDLKVINVALDSGFRHLGLFNSMFKRRFGTTPSDWRKKSGKKPSMRRAQLAAFAMLALLPLQTAFGQVTNAPAAAPKFEIKGYEVEGNTLLKPEQIEKIFADYKGTNVDFVRIRQGLAELQLAYRGLGYVTVGISLPQQQLTNGVVKIKVTEGRLAAVNVVGNKYYSKENVLRAVPSLTTNIYLNNRWFQPELDQANANSDRQIYPIIGPGPEPGTSALTLKVKDRLPLHGRFDFNNRASVGTPPFRMDVAAQYNNLWQRDHQLGFSYNFTPTDLKEQDMLPARFLDQPLISSFSGFYRLPLGAKAALRPQYETTPSAFGFDEITRRFMLPPQSGVPELIFYASRSTTDSGPKIETPRLVTSTPNLEITTRSDTQNLSETHNLGSRFSLPMREMGGVKPALSFGLDYKAFHSTALSTNIQQPTLYAATVDATGALVRDIPEKATIIDGITNASPAVENFVQYLPLSWGVTLARPDKTGTTALSINQNFYLSELSVADNRFQKLAGSSRAGADYWTLSGTLGREQRIYEEWSMSFQAGGQWSTRPVISNEQFGIGGTGGVRGYQEGEEYGDRGWRILVEPRTPLIDMGLVDGSMPMRTRLSIFSDYGERYLVDPGPSRQGRMQMWGAGLAISTSVGENFSGRFTLSWALLDTPGTAAGTARAYFGVGAQF